jgi:hypothetical protein
MEPIGHVAAILNDVYLLIEVRAPVAIGEDVQVYGKVTLPTPGNVPIQEVIYPKGGVRVLTEQHEKGFYLAARYRDEKERRVRKSLGPYAGLLGEQEVVETIYGDWSAALNKGEALNVTLDRAIKVGDTVGR